MASSGTASVNVSGVGIASSDSSVASSLYNNAAATQIEESVITSDYVLHDLLECPVCMDLMYPPIQQCPNGHTICSACKSRVRCCPICHHELGNIRCLALEKVAESLELPCKYHISGCQHVSLHHIRIRHERFCQYCPYKCPYAGTDCSVTGATEFLVAHLVNDHKVDMHDGFTFNHRYVKSDPQEVENAIWMLTVFYCFGHYFCLHFEAFQLGMAPVYMAFLRFMGSHEDAQKFSYSIEVGGKGRKLVWQGVPRSIRDDYRKVRNSLDGLIIQRNMALFLGEDGQELKLKLAGRIWENA